MIRFPFAKINLGLHVLGERSDGYHEIRSVLYPIGLCDILETIPHPAKVEPELSVSGDPEHEVREDDLLFKAYRQLPRSKGKDPPRMHLHKKIPLGAGLGGGSSDAGQLIRYYASEAIDPFDPEDPYARAAAQVGSDVPFFLQDRPALISGRGERMEPIALDLAGWHLLLIVPPFSASTKAVYEATEMKDLSRPPLQELVKRPVEAWRNSLENDLEKAAFEQHPQLRELKDELYDAGAVHAAMTGSGSGVFGLFPDEAASIPGAEGCFQWREKLPPLT